MAEQARQGVRDGVAGARDEASRQANRGIERTAEEVSRTSDALEAAAGEFEDGSLQHHLFRRAAEGLSELSGSIRGRTINQVANELANFGRRNPAAFIGGAALVGFAIARFARASQPSAYDRQRDGYAGARGTYGTYGEPRPYGTTGASTTPMAGPATTGATTGVGGAGAAQGSTGVRPVGPATGSAAGSTGGGSAGSLGGTSTGAGGSTGPSSGVKPSTSGGGVGQTGSDPSNKGKPNV